MKLDDTLATLQESIIANGGTKELAAKVINDLRKAADEEKADRKATAKRQKHDWGILVSDPEGLLKGKQLVGWAFQLEQDANVATLPDRVKAAAEAFNASKRGRRIPVTTVGQAIETVPAKWWKTDDGRVTRVKSKTAISIVTTDNRLPGYTK